ncbi:MAG: helix-turn-helix domain-containing protein [Campylobacteraceae bacterium]|jgi:excisionase family DNA binding protein|nr:helix-turn-helix domain-containing protein [Campylobacteraceae bacterium]
MGKMTLTPKEAAEYLGISTTTLQRLRSNGLGARYFKSGKGKNSKVLYPISELTKFMEQHLTKTAS